VASSYFYNGKLHSIICGLRGFGGIWTTKWALVYKKKKETGVNTSLPDPLGVSTPFATLGPPTLYFIRTTPLMDK